MQPRHKIDPRVSLAQGKYDMDTLERFELFANLDSENDWQLQNSVSKMEKNIYAYLVKNQVRPVDVKEYIKDSSVFT